MGHVLVVSEQAMYDTYYEASRCNLYTKAFHTIDKHFYAKAKKNPKVQFGRFWTQIEQTSHCVCNSA